jgi:poly(3-hydroxybutyrate) depolymerase
MSTRSWAFVGLSVLSLLGASATAAAAEDLPKLGVTLPATSVSGLSSGAYMAGQIELAHSKDIVGAGIVAAGPFACAETASSELFPYGPSWCGRTPRKPPIPA